LIRPGWQHTSAIFGASRAMEQASRLLMNRKVGRVAPRAPLLYFRQPREVARSERRALPLGASFMVPPMRARIAWWLPMNLGGEFVPASRQVGAPHCSAHRDASPYGAVELYGPDSPPIFGGCPYPRGVWAVSSASSFWSSILSEQKLAAPPTCIPEWRPIKFAARLENESQTSRQERLSI
jgi:hypothetical protein